MTSRPVLTQAISITVLFGAGDVLAQQLVEKKSIKGHDFIRTGRMAFYGGGILFEPIHSYPQLKIVAQRYGVQWRRAGSGFSKPKSSSKTKTSKWLHVSQ
jgi:hypothetical protein